MPRIHIAIQDIDAIEKLDEQEDWEQQLGLRQPVERRDVRTGASGRVERRLGGSEARDRKNSERRKQVHRGSKY